MATIFQDLFSGTNGADIDSRAADSGGTWVKNSGFPGAIKLNGSGTAYAETTAVYSTNNTGVGNCKITAVIDVKSNPPGTAGAYASLVLRGAQDATVWHSFGINDTARPFFGYDTSISQYRSNPATADGFIPLFGVGQHTLRFSVTGTSPATFRGWVDGREIYRESSEIGATGRIGIISGNTAGASEGNHYDSFLADDSAVETRNQIQFVGDSMTWGAYNDGSCVVQNVGWSAVWPSLVVAQLQAAGADFDWANLGASGKAIAQMYTTRNTAPTDRYGLAYTKAGASDSGWGWLTARRTGATHDIIVLMGGLNDIISNGQDGAGAYADMENCITAAKAAGFYVIVLTNPLCNEGAHTCFTVPAGTNVKLAAMNALIVANSAGADAVVNFDDNPLISTDYTNATYRSATTDGVHWIGAAQQLVADLVYPAVAEAMGISSGGGGSYLGGGFGSFYTS